MPAERRTRLRVLRTVRGMQRRWFHLGGCILLLTFLFGGCSPAEERSSAADALDTTASEQERLVDVPAPLKVGEVKIEWNERGVTLRCREAPTVAVLQQLAKKGGFELQLRALPSRVLTLQIEEQAPAEVIARVLSHAAYEAVYALDPETGAQYLATLRVGESPPAKRTAASTPQDAHTQQAAAEIAQAVRRVLASEGEGRDQASEEAVDRRRAMNDVRRERLALLEDEDPELRAEAVADLDPTGENLARLKALLRSDPDSRVRTAAVSQLGEGDSYGATAGLIEALQDSEPEVVIEALDHLAFKDDPTLSRHIEPLRKHADPGVRSAAEDAIEFLED